MTDILVITPHSFVDVITNSSTELFVCDSEKGLTFVVDILKELFKLYKQSGDEDDWYSDDFYEVFHVELGSTDEHEDLTWLYEDGDIEKGEYIIITGAADNAVPYKLFDFIENIFNAKHYHM